MVGIDGPSLRGIECEHPIRFQPPQFGLKAADLVVALTLPSLLPLFMGNYFFSHRSSHKIP